MGLDFGPCPGLTAHELDIYYASRYRRILRSLPWNVLHGLSTDRARFKHGTLWAAIGLGKQAGEIWREVYDERTLLRPANGAQRNNANLMRAAP